VKDEADIGDFPPTVIQLQQPALESLNPYFELPWEKGLGIDPLWRTAVHVTVYAERVGATFQRRGVLRAAMFAFLAELLAVGSMAATLIAALFIAFPKQAMMSLLNEAFMHELMTFGSSVILLVATSLVLLHWLWALATELGAWHHELPRRVPAALALSAYSCGWDLVTSPFGILALSFTRGWRSVGPTLRAALRAPRRCAVAHLEQSRGFSPQQRQAVFVFAAWLTGPVVVLLALGLLVTLVVAMA
jgi:hypothetical protein